MAEPIAQTIRIDGGKIRRIREDKKLTQLYVAKVVGVTTDTISRWENNRYPSIKRENALSVCEALEVPLDEIIESQVPETSEVVPENVSSSRGKRRYLLLLPVFLALGVLYYYYQKQEGPVPSFSSERVLSHYGAPGGVVPVRVRLDPGPGVQGFILREHFPPGWKLIEAVPPASSLNNEEGTVRWIIKPGETQRVISYLVQVPPDARVGETVQFSGEIVANPKSRSSAIDVDGNKGVVIDAFLWADTNGDHIIDDVEMLAASGTVEEMKGIHLDWGLLEGIWSSEGYIWDQDKQRFIAAPSKP